MRLSATAAFALALTAPCALAQRSGAGLAELTLIDLAGNREIVTVLPDSAFAPRLSPDGRRITYDIFEFTENGQFTGSTIWIADIADPDDRHALPRYRTDANFGPAWSPDGERILFLTSAPDGDTIAWRPAGISGEPEHLLDARAPESWADGGRALTYLTLAGNGDYGIALFEIDSGETRELIDLPGSAEHSSNVSPDGRWFAFSTNQSGRFEVWIASLTDPEDRWQLTRDGGGHPLWSPDGQTIFFDRDHRLFRIGVDVDAQTATSPAEPLPITGFEQGTYRRQFDLTADGERFLMLFVRGQ